MKLTGDYSSGANNRRRIAFRLDGDDVVTDILFSLCKLYKDPTVVFYKKTEIRLPATICRDSVKLAQAVNEISPDKIEIGEGAGFCNVFYEINRFDSELICSGPIEYDFYAEIIKAGLTFSF